MQSSTTVRLLEWSSTDDNQFVSYQGSNSKLDLFQITKEKYKRVNLIGSREINQISCMEFANNLHGVQQNLAIGTANGGVSLIDFAPGSSDIIINNQSKYGRRPCTGVAWNPQVPGVLAAAFDKLRSDYSCIIWDIQGRVGDDKEESNVLFRLSFDEAASSLAWIPMDAQLLAIGTSKGLLRIYDTRVKNKPIEAFMAQVSLGF